MMKQVTGSNLSGNVMYFSGYCDGLVSGYRVGKWGEVFCLVHACAYGTRPGSAPPDNQLECLVITIIITMMNKEYIQETQKGT